MTGELRRKEERVVEIPVLYVLDARGRAHRLYFQLTRPKVARLKVADASILDVAAHGMAAAVSFRPQVGEQVHLCARDQQTDELMFEQEYTVRSVRDAKQNDTVREDYVVGLQLRADSVALLFKAFEESRLIERLIQNDFATNCLERLRTMFPGYERGSLNPDRQGQSKGNVQINISSIKRPQITTELLCPKVPQQPEAGNANGGKPSEPVECTFLVAGPAGQTCRAALALNGLMFSGFDIPDLPLEPCDHREECSCRLREYSDRRMARRRAEAERRSEPAGGEMSGRRLGVDRRQPPADSGQPE